jgi:DNA-binding MarR family transcriptional regulator
MSTPGDDEVARLQDSFVSVVRALGLLRPDTTPCGQPVSVTEAHAIAELHDHGPHSQKDLAASLALQKSTVSRLVDQLEANDLAARVPNPSDRRSVLVALTPNGKRRAQRLATAKRSLFAGLLDQLDADARRTVIDGLTHLDEAAHART